MLSNCAYVTTNKLINEQFILNLIEIFFLTDLPNANVTANATVLTSSSTLNTSSASSTSNSLPLTSTITNFDGLWTIISLLTPSNTLLVNCQTEIDQLIKLRLKVCSLIIKYVHTNLNSLQYFVKSNGWQDILCQLLCYTPKTEPTAQQQLETSSSGSALTNNQNKKVISRLPTVDSSLYTSTPTASSGNNGEDKTSKRRSFRESKMYHETLDSVNSDVATIDNSSIELGGGGVGGGGYSKSISFELASRKPSESGDENSIGGNNYNNNDVSVKKVLLKQQASQATTITSSNHSSIYDEYVKIDASNLFASESEICSSTTENEFNVNFENDAESTKSKLFEKIIYLINKFTWDGIAGSNETAWKERCLLFSSIYRLHKEYNFIKPVDQIQTQILEKYLQRCYTDIKKNAQSNSVFYENAREIIKLVDYFIIKNETVNQINEKFVSIIVTLLDQFHTINDKLASSQNTSSSSSSISNSKKMSKKFKSSNSVALSSPASSELLHKQMSTTSAPMTTVSSLHHQISTDADGLSNSGESSATLSTSSSSAVVMRRNSGVASLAPIYDELTETNYLSLHILINLISSHNIDICALACAKINTILHNRILSSVEEASYLIASIDKVMTDWLSKKDDEEQHYAFLIPIMKCVVDKSYNLLKMNFQVPNIPLTNVTPTFYEDFKDYCKTDEWRIFIEKQIIPLKEQYLAMIINPCRMNMKIWWNNCYESLMITIHKRNRVLGEAKIKFENSVFDNWKKREKRETLRFQMHVMNIKRTNLIIQKQLSNILKFFNGERGAWTEKSAKDVNWMLSNKENRFRMRCKLVENPYSDSHFEASRST